MNCKYFVRIISLVVCLAFLAGCGSDAGTVTKDTANDAVAEPKIYSDKSKGISFILPAGWSVSEINDESDVMLITSDSVGSPVMLFVSRDLWAEEFSESGDVSRAFLSNELLTIGDFAESVGVESSEIECVDINGYEYYRAEVDNYSDEVENAVTWYRLDNGWFDTFVFGDDSDNEFYGAFEEVISSVVYEREYEDDQIDDVQEQEDSDSDYMPADWSDETFKRNGCTSYPLILDVPLEKCKEFTVDYQVSDVTDGKMKSDAKFQIFYRTDSGEWIKGETFYLDDDGFASVAQTVAKQVTVTEVTVHCLNSGNFSWSASMGIKNPLY